MPLSSKSIRTVVVAAIAATALAALPMASPAATRSTAATDTFTLRISAPQTVFIGRPGIIKVFGTIPLRAVHLPYFVVVVSISPKVMNACPAQSWDAKQIATATNGTVLVHSSSAVPNTNGDFMVPVGIRPFAPGRAMVCAYTNDGAAVTLARTARFVTVKRTRPPRS
jgi:hypothetical protein